MRDVRHRQARAFFQALLRERLDIHNVNMWQTGPDETVIDVDLTNEIHLSFYFSTLINGWGNADVRIFNNSVKVPMSPRRDTAGLVRLVKSYLHDAQRTCSLRDDPGDALLSRG